MTIDEAQDWLLQRLNEGAECPCCGRFAKIYQRKLYSTMAYALVQIYQYFKCPDADEWLHVPEHLDGKGVVARGGDWAKLRYWGLIEHDGDHRSGYWRITDNGKDFVEGKLCVAKSVYLFDGVVVGVEGLTTIHEALGETFDYEALMS